MKALESFLLSALGAATTALPFAFACVLLLEELFPAIVFFAEPALLFAALEALAGACFFLAAFVFVLCATTIPAARTITITATTLARILTCSKTHYLTV